jgi:hypothetical protein
VPTPHTPQPTPHTPPHTPHITHSTNPNPYIPLQVAAARPTPLAALWLGYVGTLGLQDSVSHTLVDRTVVTPEHAAHMWEQLLYLPGDTSALLTRDYSLLLGRTPGLPAPCPPRARAPNEACGSAQDLEQCRRILLGPESIPPSPSSSPSSSEYPPPPSQPHLNQSATMAMHPRSPSRELIVSNFNSLYKVGPETVAHWIDALASCNPNLDHDHPISATPHHRSSARRRPCPRVRLWLAKRPPATAQRLRVALEAGGRRRAGAAAVAGCGSGAGEDAGMQMEQGWVRGGSLMDANARNAEAETAADDGDELGLEVVLTDMTGAHEHVLVKSCADLFVDSVEVGAHSTAADAIAAGIPLVTYAGAGPAQRVAASLLRAAALLHTLARDAADARALTRRLISERERLWALRRSLAALSRARAQDACVGGEGGRGKGGRGRGCDERGRGGGGDVLWDGRVWAEAFVRLVGLLWQVALRFRVPQHRPLAPAP